MDASQSALDSLRTVEFRETLKGYHRDDVDEYLEKAAVEAEGLQEQLRQSNERLRKAAETIAQLETELAAKPEAPAPAPAPAEPVGRRRHPAADAAAGPEVRGRDQGRRRGPGRPGRRRGRGRGPQGSRSSPSSASARRSPGSSPTAASSSHEVETMARQLASERERLRSALAEMLSWVDGNLSAGGRRGVVGHQHLRRPALVGRAT